MNEMTEWCIQQVTMWIMCSNFKLCSLIDNYCVVYVCADSLVWWVTDFPNPWKPPILECECLEQIWEWCEGCGPRGSGCSPWSHQHTFVIHCIWMLCNKTWAPHQKLLPPASRAQHSHEASCIKISWCLDHVQELWNACYSFYSHRSGLFL